MKGISQNIDHSTKRILARGCDPVMSLHAAKDIPPLIGNPTYIPTTDDADFMKKLQTEKWDVIFFAPGACRYSAAKCQIPGGNVDTQGWTLKEYRQLVYKYQEESIQIVESMEERGTIHLLSQALENVKK